MANHAGAARRLALAPVAVHRLQLQPAARVVSSRRAFLFSSEKKGKKMPRVHY
jgi:hypothetical protein